MGKVCTLIGVRVVPRAANVNSKYETCEIERGLQQKTLTVIKDRLLNFNEMLTVNVDLISKHLYA